MSEDLISKYIGNMGGKASNLKQISVLFACMFYNTVFSFY